MSVSYTIIGSDNALSPDRHQAIIWTNKVNPVYPPPTWLGGGIMMGYCQLDNWDQL